MNLNDKDCINPKMPKTVIHSLLSPGAGFSNRELTKAVS